MKRFTGKTVVVTGGGRGIGLGIAERFAEEGANLVLADRDPRVEEAAEKIKSFGVGALALPPATSPTKPRSKASTRGRQSSLERLTFPSRTPASLRLPGWKNSLRRTGIGCWPLSSILKRGIARSRLPEVNQDCRMRLTVTPSSTLISTTPSNFTRQTRVQCGFRRSAA
jgi:hypothetical protein